MAPVIEDVEKAMIQGTLELPTVVHATNPRANLLADELHRFDMPIQGPAEVRLVMKAAPCAALRPVLLLLEEGEALAQVAQGRTIGCEARIEATLGSGDYRIVLAAEGGKPGGYQLEAICLSGADCTPAKHRFASNRAEPNDGHNPFEVGQFLFTHVFRTTEGLGNGRFGATPPNMALIHAGPTGGPDAQSCVSCHNIGGIHGGGGLDDNIFQGGDGEHEDQAFKRNAPAVRGGGVRQAIAAQITASLKQQHEDGETELCADSLDGPICYASVDAGGNVEGHGIDSDLVIEPFGWKGREATLRGFVKGGFRVHFGMQADEAISDFCSKDAPTEVDLFNFKNTWGDPSVRCEDPDGDDVTRELTIGQLDAMGEYLQALGPPPAEPSDDDAEARALFEKAKCDTCHTRGFELDGEPHEIWSDFRRHDMGVATTDPKDFGHDGATRGVIGARIFVTSPLWDLARSAPYWHDGSAETVEAAIYMHGGDGAESVEAYDQLLDDGEKRTLLAWLESLGS